MIRRIDHVSVAVRDLDRALVFFVGALGGRVLYTGCVPGQPFRWTTIELGTSCLLELIDPLGDEGFLHDHLRKRGEGLHHITVQVDDLEGTCRRLSDKGVPTFGLKQPVPGWKEAYIHPKNAFGALIQLAEFNPLDWIEPGYIPAAYGEFAPAQDAGDGGGACTVRRIQAAEGYRFEIRRGKDTLNVPESEVEGLIGALKKAVAAPAARET